MHEFTPCNAQDVGTTYVQCFLFLDPFSLLCDDLKQKLSTLEGTRRNMEIYWQQELEEVTNAINVQVL